MVIKPEWEKEGKCDQCVGHVNIPILPASDTLAKHRDQGPGSDNKEIFNAYQGHHKCAAVERLYLPREKGGRGLVSLEQLWEREQISAIQYLQQSCDPWLKGVLNFMADLFESENKNPLAASRTILRKYARSIPETELDV